MPDRYYFWNDFVVFVIESSRIQGKVNNGKLASNVSKSRLKKRENLTFQVFITSTGG